MTNFELMRFEVFLFSLANQGAIPLRSVRDGDSISVRHDPNRSLGGPRRTGEALRIPATATLDEARCAVFERLQEEQVESA